MERQRARVLRRSASLYLRAALLSSTARWYAIDSLETPLPPANITEQGMRAAFRRSWRRISRHATRRAHAPRREIQARLVEHLSQVWRRIRTRGRWLRRGATRARAWRRRLRRVARARSLARFPNVPAGSQRQFAIIRLALPPVDQDLVGGRYLHEGMMRRAGVRSAGDVRMIPFRQEPVALPDLLRSRGRPDPKYLVMGALRWHPSIHAREANSL